MDEKTETTYRYLEARPHPWRKQLWIKGRNMTVWQFLCVARVNYATLEEAAKDYGLPVEVAHEALDYYEKNKELLHAEAAEEKQRLIEEWGWKLD